MAGDRATAKKGASAVLKDTAVHKSKSEADTLRLWELYQDQAYLWRAIALLQIPATLLLLIFAMWVYGNRTIMLNIPQKPAPGQYSIDQVIDPILVDAATDFVNLIGSYTPKSARSQFIEAEKRVVEPLLSTFTEQMIEGDLKAIEQTQRTQVFFADPSKTVIERGRNGATVTFEGDRLKIVAGVEAPYSTWLYHVTLETRPRHALNEYGVVVTGLHLEKKQLPG
jgi:hypothetical protein